MIRKISILALFLVAVSFVSAAPCDISVNLLNQDPYPAVPGDYVDIVFQIGGLANVECGIVDFTLLEKYPISLDPGTNPVTTFSSGTFTKDYSSSKNAPYRVRVDEDAINGNNTLEVSFSSKGNGNKTYQTKQFNLDVQDVRADFEIFVDSYETTTNTMTFEVLNIADSDVEALTLEIPKQEGVVVKGPNRNILGNLDSNEYTTADFEVTSEKRDIKVLVYYTDTTGVRRTITKSVNFDPSYFVNRKADEKKTPTTTYVILAVIVLIAGYFVYKKLKKKPRK